MALPVVVTKNLAASSATSIVNAQGVLGPNTAFTLATAVVDTSQRRVLITTTGNESSNTYTVVGTNDAGFQITENITGPNNTTAQSNLDFKTVLSVKASATTGGTTSVGTNAVGSSLWNIVNWHVTPFNLQFGTVLQTGAATWSIQYTYDDPNNLPSGVTVPTAFNHPTVLNATASIDGSTNDPVTAWRLNISGGTGTVRVIGIQAGIGSP